MRKLLLFVGLLTNVMYAVAQQSPIDSIQHLLENTNGDSARGYLLASLASAYRQSRPDTSLLLAEEGLTIAKRTKDPKMEVRCLRMIAVTYEALGDFPRSLETLQSALKIAESLNDPRTNSVIADNLATIYFDQGDFKQSIYYSHQALNLVNTRDMSRFQSLMNLGDTYEKADQLDSALWYGEAALHLQDSLRGNSDYIVYNNLANVYVKQHRDSLAMAYYRKSIPGFYQNENISGLAEATLGIAELFRRKHNNDSALWYAHESLRFANESEWVVQANKSANYISSLYADLNKFDSAYAYQLQANAIKDSVYNQDRARSFQNLAFEEKVRQMQIEDAKKQAYQSLKQKLLIAGLAVFAVIAFLLFRFNSRERKNNKTLQAQKEEIDQKAHELEVQKDSLQKSYSNIELLEEIGKKITASLSVETIIGTVYTNVNSLMDANVFGIGIYNEEKEQIEFPATYEGGEALPFYINSIHDENRFASICFNRGTEILIDNLNEQYTQYLQQIKIPKAGEQPHSLIFLPLLSRDKKLGVITVQSFHYNAYTEYHLYMLRNIAVYTTIALENARSYNTLNHTVDQLKSTQTQLIQAEKMASLGELTAGIAHEIQNPLNFVNNFSEINNELADELIGEDDITEMKAMAADIKQNSEKILLHGRRADAIVKGMLQHSRSSSSQKELTDINALCDEYLRLSYHGLRAKDKSFNADLKTDFDDSFPVLRIVPQEIGRVLLNLINNAFYAVHQQNKTTPGFKPTVSVGTRHANGHVVISVADNGNGIPESIKEKIFQPFFTTKPTGQGTGLGLSLAYDIVKSHSGNIELHSVEGEGTTFTIQLPAIS